MRHSHESSISSISITLVGLIACSLFLLTGAPTMKARLQTAGLPAVVKQDAGGENAAPATQTTRVVDLLTPSPPAEASTDERLAEIDRRFKQAAMMLHAERFDDALVALHRVLELSPRLAEAHSNLGYALLGLERYEAAYESFLSATDLEPYLGNAYWGLAVALEQLGDLKGALGAMRIYIHLAPPGDPYVRRARSALWEWDSRLARGPLPENEAEWIERNTRQWVERNLPSRDGTDSGETVIPVRDVSER